jgi:hypothetical protein
MKKLANPGSIQNVVSGYMLSLIQNVLDYLGSTVHGHARAIHEKHFGAVEGQLLARVANTVHIYKVSLTLDGLNIIGLVDYSSNTEGAKGREQSKAFELQATANPSHFISQIVEFCVDQYQGHQAPASVEWTLA